MNIGIVGSRTFPQLAMVEFLVKEFPQGITVISGGAVGVDSKAVETAKKAGLDVLEYLPEKEGLTERYEFTKAFYERNQKIVDDSDLIIAFTEKNNGGTWDTIKRARLARKPVKVIRPIPRETLPDSESIPTVETKDTEQRVREKGAGPFQIKRISLGSYALKLWRYMDTVQWADFINAKDNDPQKCADMMIPDFLEFFRKYNYGHIDLISQAPKSLRHYDKVHPMDIVCQAVSNALGVQFLELFKVWNKKQRGRMAEHPDIELVEAAGGYAGKVVYILDDVTVTNETLRLATQALLNVGIHAHAIVWMSYA